MTHPGLGAIPGAGSGVIDAEIVGMAAPQPSPVILEAVTSALPPDVTQRARRVLPGGSRVKNKTGEKGRKRKENLPVSHG